MLFKGPQNIKKGKGHIFVSTRFKSNWPEFHQNGLILKLFVLQQE